MSPRMDLIGGTSCCASWHPYWIGYYWRYRRECLSKWFAPLLNCPILPQCNCHRLHLGGWEPFLSGLSHPIPRLENLAFYADRKPLVVCQWPLLFRQKRVGVIRSPEHFPAQGCFPCEPSSRLSSFETFPSFALEKVAD